MDVPGMLLLQLSEAKLASVLVSLHTTIYIQAFIVSSIIHIHTSLMITLRERQRVWTLLILKPTPKP